MAYDFIIFPVVASLAGAEYPHVHSAPASDATTGVACLLVLYNMPGTGQYATIACSKTDCVKEYEV